MASDAVAAAAAAACGMLGFVELIRFGAGAIRATTAAVAAGGRRCAVCERVGRSG